MLHSFSKFSDGEWIQRAFAWVFLGLFPPKGSFSLENYLGVQTVELKLLKKPKTKHPEIQPLLRHQSEWRCTESWGCNGTVHLSQGELAAVWGVCSCPQHARSKLCPCLPLPGHHTYPMPHQTHYSIQMANHVSILGGERPEQTFHICPATFNTSQITFNKFHSYWSAY